MAEIILDLPFSEYLKIDRLNQSTLSRCWLDDGKRSGFSPRQYAAVQKGWMDLKSTKAIGFGRAGHARLLEPDLFWERFIVANACCAMLKSGTRAGQPCGLTATYRDSNGWYCGKHNPVGAEDLGEVDHVTLKNLVALDRVEAALKEDPAVNLIRTHGGYEVTALGELEGFPMKGRIDKDIPTPPYGKKPCMLDLKFVSSKTHTSTKFRKKIEDYHYDVQMAIYHDLLFQADGIDRQCSWMVVEADGAHDIIIYDCPPEYLEGGRKKYREALFRLGQAKKAGHWPGHGWDWEHQEHMIHPIRPSDYYCAKYEIVREDE